MSARLPDRALGALLLVALLAACHSGPGERRSGTPRNVILMMADDLASNDLSCYGGRNIQTPHLDALAKESLRLTDYYAGSAVCTPSRMALLSGAYPARLGWRRGVLGYGFARGTGMSTHVHTIAEAFRDAGYHTAMAGKWHLGDGDMRPEAQGFDSSLYIRMSNNQNRDMYRDGALVQEDWDNRTLTEAFAKEAVRVIEADRDEPFFLYLPWSAPHFPAEPHPEWQGRSGDTRAARYKDVVEELDHRIGALLRALERTGKADDTIVVFTSDNGRQRGQQGARPDPLYRGQKWQSLERTGKADDTIVVFTSDNGRQRGQQGARPDPLYRGQKWQSLEGGTRVPCLVRCPGAITPGVSDQLVSAMDLFPTLAAACGVEIAPGPSAQRLDGMDLWKFLTDRTAATPGGRSELLYWHGQGAATALRQGRWKLRFHADDQQPVDPPLASGPELFDLADDPREQRDLAAVHLEQVAAMLRRARALLEDVYAEQVPLGALPDAAPLPARRAAREVWGPSLSTDGR